jgi:subtilisin family serine protease
MGTAWAVLATQVLTASAATSTPNDPWFASGQQWGLTQGGFPSAWCASTGAGALIAVIDGGVDFGNPDLAGKSAGSYTLPGVAPGVTGHATHVAGIAAAATGNGIGMAGAAPDARLYSVKMLDASGQGTSTNLAAAIRYVTEQVAPTWPGPVVLNISVGATTASTPGDVASAIGEANSHGLGVALAAGDQPGSSGYGDMNGQAMVVGALGQNGAVASYSPTGGVNVFAAGGENISGTNVGTGIISTYAGGQYAWLTGTSMATPHVAAALALLMSGAHLSNQQAYSRIVGTEASGALRVDRALGSTGSCGAPAPRPAPAPVVRPAPRPYVPPVTAAAPAPPPASVQTAPPAAAPTAAPAVAAALPNTSYIPYDEATHPHRTLTGPGPLATAIARPPTGFQQLLATTSASARTQVGRVSLAGAGGFAVAYWVSLVLWRRLNRVRLA